MEIVRDVKSFVSKNGKQLQKLFIYKTGITDRDLVQEHLQDFYVKMIQTNALESYDEEEGSFETYIFTLLCWLMPYKAKKNVSVLYNFVTHVRRDTQTVFTADEVWDHTGNFEGPYKVDFSPCTPRILDSSEEQLFKGYLREFKEYIQKTEHGRCKKQLLTFFECKQSGCKSTEIAVILGVSDNMVKFIKQKLQRKFARWKTLN